MDRYKFTIIMVLIAFTFSAGLFSAEIASDSDEIIPNKTLKQKFREFSVYLNMSSKDLGEKEFKQKLDVFFKNEINKGHDISLEALNLEGDGTVLIESVKVTKRITLEVKPGIEKKILPLLIRYSKKHHVRFHFTKKDNFHSISLELVLLGSSTDIKRLGHSLLKLKSKILYKLGTLLSN